MRKILSTISRQYQLQLERVNSPVPPSPALPGLQQVQDRLRDRTLFSWKLVKMDTSLLQVKGPWSGSLHTGQNRGGHVEPCVKPFLVHGFLEIIFVLVSWCCLSASSLVCLSLFLSISSSICFCLPLLSLPLSCPCPYLTFQLAHLFRLTYPLITPALPPCSLFPSLPLSLSPISLLSPSIHLSCPFFL